MVPISYKLSTKFDLNHMKSDWGPNNVLHYTHLNFTSSHYHDNVMGCPLV